MKKELSISLFKQPTIKISEAAVLFVLGDLGQSRLSQAERSCPVIFKSASLLSFLIHAIYTFILYLIGNRDKYLLYFSMLMFCMIMTSLLSNGEKLIHQFFNIPYDFDFRIANTLLLLGCYALLQCTNHLELPYWKRIFPFINGVYLP